MVAIRQAISTPRKILVADPDAESRGKYAHLLGLLEADIVHATDGRDALVKVLEHRFALLITEAQLPLIDGYALCEVIRRDAFIRTIPIVVVTADARPTALRRALIAGADVVLAKPFPVDALSVQAKRLLVDGSGGAHGHREDQPIDIEPASEPADGSARTRAVKSRAHKRYETTQPPAAPPVLRCPSCDASLVYGFSHVGGVSAREPEQWDYYTCSGACGQFRYRQRTRKLQRA